MQHMRNPQQNKGGRMGGKTSIQEAQLSCNTHDPIRAEDVTGTGLLLQLLFSLVLLLAPKCTYYAHASLVHTVDDDAAAQCTWQFDAQSRI
jgi:hypothetical protein